MHIEWDTTAPVTPLGQLPFFIEYLKQGGLFDGWVADCPLSAERLGAGPQTSASALGRAIAWRRSFEQATRAVRSYPVR